MTENSSNLEEMFKDRYTNKDERYAKLKEDGFDKVVVVHPWNPRRDNKFRGRGGFRGGRGEYRGGGGWNPRGGHRGGGWNDRGGHRGGWRGGEKRPYNNN